MPGAMGAAMGRKKAKKAAKMAELEAARGGGGSVRKSQSVSFVTPPGTAGTSSSSQDDEGKALIAKMKSRRTATKFLKELVIFTVWVLSFTMTLIFTRDNTQTFQFGNLFKSYLIENDGWTSSLKTVEDFWLFIEDNTEKVLANDIFSTYGDDFGAAAADQGFLYGNKRIGQLRIRQVRVPSEQCSSVYLERILSTSTPDLAQTRCYPAFSPSATLEREYTKEDPEFEPDVEVQPWFKFWTRQEILEMAFFSATFATYPGSGYVLDIENAHRLPNGELLLQTLPFGESEYLNVTLNEVKESRWVDLKTRAVFFDFSFFNPNLNVFLVARVVVEFLPSGIASISRTFRIVDPFRFGTATTAELVNFGLNGVVAIITFIYFVEALKEMYKLKWKFFRQFWLMTALVNTCMMLALLGLTAVNELQARSLFVEGAGDLHQGDLQSLGFMLDQEKNLSGVVVLIMWVRFYKYCTISRKLSTLTRTLAKSASSLFLFMILFIIAAFGFSLGGTLIFGADTYNFYNLSISMFTLLRASFGDFDYNDWSSNRVVGPALLITWCMFSNAILLNIIVAVVCEAFTNVMMENEDLDEKGVKSVLDIFLESGLFGRKMAAKMQRRRNQIGDIETALSTIDADGDGMTDINELEAWIKSTGADKTLGITATELMAKYDTDGSGQLDAEEMEEIKAYILREKELKTPAEGEMLDIDQDMTMMGKRGYAEVALMGGGGWQSSGTEERILTIESSVLDIKNKVNMILAKLETMSMAPPPDIPSGRPATTSALGTLKTAYRGDGHKIIATKTVVAED
mmetsp:Transcript_42132/g.86104  ORF Transcript_42132/g.86104 Transcript_42132/m.86104 type:complete len:800 (+) Transcript_42132:150-2549(+)|eukprot:CAMPEP_0181299486 /NCGR_PEP_ID=MMETSP1101-20121128/6375_1 /TAXON_ID=46948 /ORGANISM="Rhodomonas abbreviata, Strain Caron Lab Isolate" /LENGTH=799 /DNA_ID=CAMNT_0023404645 /DNA_START=150 /DNA_END=2549 /DNA_ORIENTATION=-